MTYIEYRQMDNFNLSRIKTLSPNDSKVYITKYFVPLDNGNHAMLIDGKYFIKEDSELKRSYFNRMSKELCNYYFKDFTEVKSITYEMNKPVFFDDKINLCPQMKWKYNKLYVPSEEAREGRDFFLNFISEILCSKKVEVYQFLLKWLSNMVKGNKNTSCLYMKGPQGIGKSTLFECLSRYVVGNDLSLETGSDPIKTKFNEILGGKLLINIEELENFSKAEWESISSILKRLITSSRITLQNKCTKSYEATNINNYILCSNNDAIKDDEGRRYFILDLSTHKVGDCKYYTDLYKMCMNDEVGEALFHYLYEIDTIGFNAQSFPITQSKIDSQVKRLDSVYKFLKEYYILMNRPLEASCSDLYSEYKMIDPSRKCYTREDFHKKLQDVGFTRSKVGTKWSYNYSYETLLNVANKKNWMHELDEFIPAQPNVLDL